MLALIRGPGSVNFPGPLFMGRRGSCQAGSGITRLVQKRPGLGGVIHHPVAKLPLVMKHAPSVAGLLRSRVAARLAWLAFGSQRRLARPAAGLSPTRSAYPAEPGKRSHPSAGDEIRKVILLMIDDTDFHRLLPHPAVRGGSQFAWLETSAVTATSVS